MVRHWYKERGPGWRRSAFLNGLGATTTAIVVAIFAIAKFALGAWIILLVVPILVILMLFVQRQYRVGSWSWPWIPISSGAHRCTAGAS